MQNKQNKFFQQTSVVFKSIPENHEFTILQITSGDLYKIDQSEIQLQFNPFTHMLDSLFK